MDEEEGVEVTRKGPLEKALERLERERKSLLERWQKAKVTAAQRVDEKYLAESQALVIQIDGVKELLAGKTALEPELKGDADAVGN